MTELYTPADMLEASRLRHDINAKNFNSDTEFIENMLDDYETRHMNALKHKISQYVNTVTQIANHNSQKELKAAQIKEEEKKKEKEIFEKYMKKYEKIVKAREIVNENLQYEKYNSTRIKTQRLERVERNKQQIKRDRVSCMYLIYFRKKNLQSYVAS